MSTFRSFFRLPVVCLILLLTGCVKDVDISQAQEIVIPPTAALDLVYFTIDGSHFHGSSGQLVARDEVRLEFLDDDYIRNGLVRADYNFIYTNSFEFPIRNTITLLSESNVVRYRFQFDIPAGSAASPATVNYTEIIGLNDIDAVRESITMVISLEMQPTSTPVEGELKLKSKAFYEFEFK